MKVKNIALIAVLLGLAAALAGMAAPEAPVFERAQITLHIGKAQRPMEAELATRPEQQAYGLKNRDQLTADGGMLFDFGTPRMISMWMEDTRIPLDMLFLDAHGTVVHIEQNTQPFSRQTLSAGVPVRGVLELNAGKVKEWGLQRGDRVAYEGWK